MGQAFPQTGWAARKTALLLGCCLVGWVLVWALTGKSILVSASPWRGGAALVVGILLVLVGRPTPTSAPATNPVSTSRKVTFTVLIWLGLFLVLELAARAYVAVTGAPRLDDQVTRHAFNHSPMFRSHPFAAYAANPANPSFSSQGFREEVHYTPEHEGLRIVCLGGSSTYDTRTWRHEAYPAQLAVELTKPGGPTVEVINAGLAGYSTPNIIGQLALQILEYHPDICIFDVGFNDAWNRIHYAGCNSDYTHALRSWEIPARPWWRYSVFLDRLAERLGSRSTPHIHEVCWGPESGRPEDNWKQSSDQPFRRNLATLVGICKAHHIRPVFLTQATDFPGHPTDFNDLWIGAMEETTQALREVLAAEEANLIDVRTPLSNRTELFADCLHLNAAGNRERARIIAAELQRTGLLVPGKGGTMGTARNGAPK
jgi:lysophospholipase L1-like esterase